MMQNQRTEWIDLTIEKESSVNTEAHATANEQDMLLNIDFGNIEDVLDFSAPLVPTPTNVKNPKDPTEPCEPMTEEPVKIQPTISNIEFSKINGQNMLSNINFENVEDILDFSAQLVLTPTIIKNPRHLVEPCDLMTAEPDKIQPTISNNEFSKSNKVNYKTKPEQKMRFQCIICGNKFARSIHLRCHMYIHVGAMPYFCPVCRKRFSKNDHMLAHFYNHRNNTLHYCCVCGEAYNNLEEFSIHCRSHADSVYIKIAIDGLITDSDSSNSENDSQKEPIRVEDHAPVANSAERLGTISSVKMKGECITCVDNPLYLSHHKAISINSNVATSYSNTDSLMVSINVVHTLP